jgi:hypothetical protein
MISPDSSKNSMISRIALVQVLHELESVERRLQLRSELVHLRHGSLELGGVGGGEFGADVVEAVDGAVQVLLGRWVEGVLPAGLARPDAAAM